MTESEKFVFIISQPHIRKKIIESKRTQTVEYWINAYRVACKFKQFSYGRAVYELYYVYPETVSRAQAVGLLPAYPKQGDTKHV